MKLISWNVNGLRAACGKGFMVFFESCDADFFCVQETKMQREQSAFQFPGYREYWNDAQKKGYSGTLTLCRQEPLNAYYSIGTAYEDAPGHDAEGRFVILEYAGFFLVNVYAPNSQRLLARLDYRAKWQDDFSAFLKGLDKPAIICGDLNVAHTEADIENPAANRNNAGFTDCERDKMTELLNAGFTDTFRHLHKDARGAYTWWSYMRGARERNIGWRIDYILVSKTLKTRILTAGIMPEVHGSDHCPVYLDLDLDI